MDGQFSLFEMQFKLRRNLSKLEAPASKS